MKCGSVAIICGMLFTATFGQEREDLYYAQPPNTGLYLGFVYVNNDNFILAGLNKLYLFNRQKLLTDTLNLSVNRATSFQDNIMHIRLLEDSQISVATLNRTLMLSIQSDKFRITEDYLVNNLAGRLGRHNLFILFKNGILGYSLKGKNIVYEFFHRVEKTGNFHQPGNKFVLQPNTEVKFMGSEIIAFTKFQSAGTNIFLFNRRGNSLCRLDTSTGTYQRINLPALDNENEAHEFFIDPHTHNMYLLKLARNKENSVFLMSEKNYSLTEVGRVNFLVRGVFNNKWYVAGMFDGAFAHYLIPIYGQNEKVNFFDHH